MPLKSGNKSARGAILLVIAAALLFATGFLAVSWRVATATEADQRLRLVEMTNSFVSIYAETRGDSTIVPATFRRMGIDHFTLNRSPSTTQANKSIRMPGRPGFELETVESDARLRSIIQEYVDDPAKAVREENRLENGRMIARTIFPSIANSESCTSCHNATLGAEVYKTGDVMGAFVVESDLTPVMWRNFRNACGVFIVALLIISWLARREQKRMATVVSTLEKRVVLEQQKFEAEAKAKFLMAHDPLTGLANRKMFHDKLEKMIAGDEAMGTIVGLLDLDDFKNVNDTFGHGGGDAQLKEVAHRLAEIIDLKGGVAARFGGDEFAFVVNVDSFPGDPSSVGEEIIKAMQEPFDYESMQLNLRCSVGLAVGSSVTDLTPNDLIRAADSALYAVKSSGKHGYRLYDDAIRASVGRRNKLAAQLPIAIAESGIRAVLQPQICLKSHDVVGFEALARWRCDNEEILPAEFIPIAEELSVIRTLDLAVLARAAEFVARHNRSGKSSVSLSANLSAESFYSDDLCDAILMILADTGLSPKLLMLEVTESVSISDWDRVQKALLHLGAHGVRASLDDFGTGYSSLSYLKQSGFDAIKIDRSFITEIVTSEDQQFLFQSMLNIANGLNKLVVVEGIETQEQADFVSRQGAQVGQGYYYSRPLEFDDVEDFLESCYDSRNLVDFRTTA